MVFYPEETS